VYLCALYYKRKSMQKENDQERYKRSNMILKEFNTGWQETFREKIQSLFNVFPNLTVKDVKRFHGMLRLNFEALDKDTQYIVNCVSYKIERESATTCEMCGEYGIRRDEFLTEKQCLCWKCYALLVDAIDQRNALISQ